MSVLCNDSLERMVLECRDGKEINMLMHQERGDVLTKIILTIRVAGGQQVPIMLMRQVAGDLKTIHILMSRVNGDTPGIGTWTIQGIGENE